MKLILSSRLKMPNLKSTSRAAVIKRRTLCRATVLCVFCVASWITDQMSIPGACSTRWTFMPCSAIGTSGSVDVALVWGLVEVVDCY